MNNIEFYILKSTNKVVAPFFSSDNELDRSSLYRPAFDSLYKQIKEIGIDAEVSIVDSQEVPIKTNSFLISFLNENSLIPDDYIVRLLATNNLHRDAAMFCGPVTTTSVSKPTDWFMARLAKIYKSYKLDSFCSFISCLLNNDPQNYPPIEGCTFSGRHYNLVGGYSPVMSPRYLIDKNIKFLQSIDQAGPIVYNARLSTMYYLNKEELEQGEFYKFFYARGFNDALINITSNETEIQLYELKHEYRDLDVPSDVKDTYQQICKTIGCLYEVGRTEAITNTKVGL